MPQNSERAPSTVAANMELVPSPDPAGIADRSVISIPDPKSCRNSVRVSDDVRGAKPARVSAALGIENGEPTV